MARRKPILTHIGDYDNGREAYEMFDEVISVNLVHEHNPGAGKFYFDTNNFPTAYSFAVDQGLVRPTGDTARSGFATYPLVEFVDAVGGISSEDARRSGRRFRAGLDPRVAERPIGTEPEDRAIDVQKPEAARR